MHKSQSVGYVLIAILALVALGFIFSWQTGGRALALPSLSDGRVVEKLSGPSIGKIKRRDLQVGDRVVAINDIEVRNWRQAYKILESLYQHGPEMVAITVVRQDEDGVYELLDKPVQLKRTRIGTLILRGAPSNSRPGIATFAATPERLFDAAQAGDAPQVEQLLDSGGKRQIDKVVDNSTALIAAVEGGHVGVVRLLLDYKADVNRLGAGQTSPLMKAAEAGNIDVVALLMEAGANTSVRNSQLKTAADIADGEGFLEVADFIERPSPVRFLTRDQRRKVVVPLRDMGLIKKSGLPPTDIELTNALRAYQRQANLPVSGILTANSFSDLVKFAERDIKTKYKAQLSVLTKKTLSRVFARTLAEDWSVVNSTAGYPQCEVNYLDFDISTDQKTITLQTYAPDIDAQGLIDTKVEAQEPMKFKVVWADQIDGYDTILVKPDPRPETGGAYQRWQIRGQYMQIYSQDKKDSEPEGTPSHLAMCR